MTKNISGQGKNQSATDDLNIPTLGSGPVVQPGEDPAAIAALSASTPAKPAGLDDFIDPESPAAQVQHTGAVHGAPAAREMSRDEMQSVLQQLAAQQGQMMSLISALARNNPVMSRNDQEQFGITGKIAMDMPIDGSLDRMRRPDQKSEPIDIDIYRNMDHAAQLAFLEEYVVINIHDTAEQGAENPVPLWVNGRGVAIVRGEDTAVRRKYVELLLRAKPEGVKTRIIRGGPDAEPVNRVEKTRSLRYPFSIVVDRNPKGIAWARKIRTEA